MDNMKNLKIVSDNDLKDWAKEIFKKNSFKMIDVSKKKETFRRALASGKIYVGGEVFELIKNAYGLVKSFFLKFLHSINYHKDIHQILYLHQQLILNIY